MHVIQFLILLSLAVRIEIVKPRLPKRPQRFSLFRERQSHLPAHTGLARLRSFRATRSFNFYSTVEGVPCFGSLIKRCTCSGMTT